jgi:hypothetical protein
VPQAGDVALELDAPTGSVDASTTAAVLDDALSQSVLGTMTPLEEDEDDLGTIVLYFVTVVIFLSLFTYVVVSAGL